MFEKCRQENTLEEVMKGTIGHVWKRENVVSLCS